MTAPDSNAAPGTRRSKRNTALLVAACLAGAAGLWLVTRSSSDPAGPAATATSQPGEPAPSAAPGDCKACKEQRCEKRKTVLLDCDRLPGNVTDGPAKGKPKREVCAAVSECIQRTRCAQGKDVQPCFCGDGVDEMACLAGRAHGPCKSILEEAGQTSDPKALAERWNDPAYAIAPAVNLASCVNGPCKAFCP